MFRLKKESGSDFTVLCLADPQLHGYEWEPTAYTRPILLHTVDTLIGRKDPRKHVPVPRLYEFGHKTGI